MRLLLLLLMCSGLTVAAARRYGILPSSGTQTPTTQTTGSTLRVPVEIVEPGGTIEHRQVEVRLEQ